MELKKPIWFSLFRKERLYMVGFRNKILEIFYDLIENLFYWRIRFYFH